MLVSLRARTSHLPCFFFFWPFSLFSPKTTLKMKEGQASGISQRRIRQGFRSSDSPNARLPISFLPRESSEGFSPARLFSHTPPLPLYSRSTFSPALWRGHSCLFPLPSTRSLARVSHLPYHRSLAPAPSPPSFQFLQARSKLFLLLSF